MSPPGALARARRPGARRERALAALLAAVSLAFGATFVATIGALLAAGGRRALSFTLYPTPLGGAPGEARARAALGLLFYGAAAWAAHGPLAAALGRLAPPSPGRRRALGFGLAAAAVALAVARRDHLPRFLVLMPSETEAGGGVAPQVWNTLLCAALSALVTMPVGVGAAVYLDRFARSRRQVAALRVALDTLASLPSVVYGLFGFLVFVVQMRAGYSLLAGAFVLALLNLPLVVSVVGAALRAVPRELEEASMALGATPVQTVFRVSLPGARAGLASALVLSAGRAFAESAPLVMTAGTAVSRANAFSLDPTRGGETLAVHLWYINSAGLSPDRAEVSAATAAVLVVLVALSNALAARLGGRGGAPP